VHEQNKGMEIEQPVVHEQNKGSQH
jgi:hypothetical protein